MSGALFGLRGGGKLCMHAAKKKNADTVRRNWKVPQSTAQSAIMKSVNEKSGLAYIIVFI